MLDRLFSRAAEHLVVAMLRRGEPAAVVLPADEYESYVETAAVLDDAEAMADLHAADQEPDEDAMPWDDVRRELGLA